MATVIGKATAAAPGVEGDTTNTSQAGVRATSSTTETALSAENNGTGSAIVATADADAIVGTTSAPSGRSGVVGRANGSNNGVYGQSDIAGYSGVWGNNTAARGQGYGVTGFSASPDGYAIWAHNTGGGHGLYADSQSGVAVFGQNAAGTGVDGRSAGGVGVHGASQSGRGGLFEVTHERGQAPALMALTVGEGDAADFAVFGANGGSAVNAYSFAASTTLTVANISGNPTAEFSATAATTEGYNLATFYSRNDGNGATAIYATSQDTTSPDGYQVWAGVFDGSVWVRDFFHVAGTFTCPNKFFRIDHPLDPANKYLVHASVEAPDRTNLYAGAVVLDADGKAAVALPPWFEALNRDVCYQLTCVGGHAPVYVSKEIHANQFRIAGGHAGLKVCWQLTGVRHDAAAKANPVLVEQDKHLSDKGRYQDAAAHGVSEDQRIGADRQRAAARRIDAHHRRLARDRASFQAPSA